MFFTMDPKEGVYLYKCSLTLHSFPVRLLHILQTRNDLPVHLRTHKHRQATTG